MKLLALDCSTEACSVALLTDNGLACPEVNQCFELAPRQHTRRILPLVARILSEHETSLKDLDAIAFGRGPGSFTGLRICLGAVQGLAFGADLPVVPVSTLAAQAQELMNANTAANGNLLPNNTVISTLDARMDEIYWGVYEQCGDSVKLLGNERLTAPEQLSIEGVDTHGEPLQSVIIGSGVNYLLRIPDGDQFKCVSPNILPTAAAVATLAHIDFRQGISCRADEALPIYLRDEVAWQKQPLLA